MSDGEALVEQLATRLRARGEWLAVGESCTGGLLAATCTARPGSSAWFERGVVTYANRAKQELLGVPEVLLNSHGAVSEACVLAMAAGLLQRAPVQHAVAISGVAGPDGGTPEKPIGTVWIAWAGPAGSRAQRFQWQGSRQAIREQAVCAALQGLLDGMG